jgi:hypothetical protein
MEATAHSRMVEQERLEDELAVMSSHLNAATARWLELLLEFRDAGGAAGEDLGTWLAFRCGLSTREGHECLRVAVALEQLPRIRDAFARGELSSTKVRALTRVATPKTEEGLLELAGSLTASQLVRALRAYMRVTSAEARESHEVEYLDYHWADDGSLVLRARLPAEDGTILVRALDACRERVWKRKRVDAAAPRDAERAGGSLLATPDLDPPRQANVEAIVELAQCALVAPDALAVEEPRLVVHVDAAALTADGPGRSELEHGPVISPETARRLSCDAEFVTSIERDGVPLSVGRTRRTVTRRLRRQLEARDRGSCRWPGCTRRRHLQAHHRTHWANGGETSLDNLTLLCFHHHRLVHEGGYTIEDAGGGDLRFRNRHGVLRPSVPRSPPMGSAEELVSEHVRSGLAIDARTNRCGEGGRMDLAYAVDALLAVTQSQRDDDCERGGDDEVVDETPDAERVDHEALEDDEIRAEADTQEGERGRTETRILAVPTEKEEHRHVEGETEDGDGDARDFGVRRFLNGLAASALKTDDVGVRVVRPGEVAGDHETGEHEPARHMLQGARGQPFSASSNAARNCVTSETRT